MNCRDDRGTKGTLHPTVYYTNKLFCDSYSYDVTVHIFMEDNLFSTTQLSVLGVCGRYVMILFIVRCKICHDKKELLSVQEFYNKKIFEIVERNRICFVYKFQNALFQSYR